MKDINVAYFGRNDDTRITSQAFYLRKELETRVNVEYVWDMTTGRSPHGERDVRVHLERAENKPDVIYMGPPSIYWEGLKDLNIPKIYWWSDPHTQALQHIEWIKEQNVSVSLHATEGDITVDRWGYLKLYDHLPEWHKAYLFPHCVNTDIFYDMEHDRDIDFLVLGRTGRNWYPLRYKIREWLKTQEDTYNIFWTRRPRGDYGWDAKRKAADPEVFMREDYANLLNKCKIFPMGGGAYRYASAKMFESMATKTLVLMYPPPVPELYHFEDGYNYVEMNHDNYIEVMEYWIDNYDSSEAKIIRENAYTMVRKRHSHKKRCDELIAIMEREL